MAPIVRPGRGSPPLSRRLARTLLLFLLVLTATAPGIGGAFAQEPAPPEPTPTAPDEPASGVPVGGSLNNGGERLAGVTVRATDVSGNLVAETTSGDGGRWELTLEPGTYTFEVDTDTLPDGVSVQTTVARDVVAGRSNVVIFSFGEARSGSEIGAGEKGKDDPADPGPIFKKND